MRGFTLIEVLIVLGILVVALSFGLFVGMDAYRATAARSERDALVAVLARARSRALANIDQSSWGVCVDGSEYVLFSGTDCVSGSGERVAISPGSLVTISVPVVFSPLAATSSNATVTIKQNGRTDAITINYEGRIDW